MGKETSIEYADSTRNEIRGCNGCELWNEALGIKICYAGNLVNRWSNSPAWPERFTEPRLFPGEISKALQWPDLTGQDRPAKLWLNGYPRIIFYNDMSDSFTERANGKALPVDWMLPYIPAMEASPHIAMLLTKRPKRAVRFFRDYVGYLPRNFWLGVSVTSRETLSRAWELLELPEEICHGVLWVSAEPLYSDIDFVPLLRTGRFGWAAIGGESGPNKFHTRLEWLQHIVADFQAYHTPIFVKQLGEVWAVSQNGIDTGKKGGNWVAWPEVLKVREMPRIKEKL